MSITVYVMVQCSIRKAMVSAPHLHKNNRVAIHVMAYSSHSYNKVTANSALETYFEDKRQVTRSAWLLYQYLALRAFSENIRLTGG